MIINLNWPELKKLDLRIIGVYIENNYLNVEAVQMFIRK